MTPIKILRPSLLFAFVVGLPFMTDAQETELQNLQLKSNPPMRAIFREPPLPPSSTVDFETREGFTLLRTLEQFIDAIKKDDQKIRMKPGVYRATSTDPPIDDHQHIFSVSGSGNHFDLRGVVIETPVSLQSKLTRKAHISDSWHIFGNNNTFEGGYFRNIVDRPYPEYGVTDCEFEVLGDDNTFDGCTFVIRGSVPYGYSDFYGKGGPNFGRLNKHSCIGIHENKNTTLRNCKFYVQSFGHCIFFHKTDGLRIENCFLSGTLRPSNDIFKETEGRATEYDFKIMYRGERPIPRDDMIPLTEDGIRSYGGDKNITIIDTTVERFRSGVQIQGDGDLTLKNVSVVEAGNYSFDVTAGKKGKVVMKNCFSDVAYSPVFKMSRGDMPFRASYEITMQGPANDVQATERTSLGTICGERCKFIIRADPTRPILPNVNYLECGGFLNKSLIDSTVTNYSTAKLILTDRTRNCRIKSIGPVEDNGKDNKIVRLSPRK